MNLNDFKSCVATNGLVRRDGRDWRGRCPAHNDDGRRGDLTFSEKDGKILVKCWNGCETKSVVAALGLKMSDLFTGSNGNGYRKPMKERPRRTYSTVEEAGKTIAAQKGIRGTFTQHWTYRNADSTEAFKVLRFDNCKALDGEKTYRPIHWNGTRYIQGDPPGLLPLYNLPQLLENKDDIVTLHEGEKSCDAAASIGLLATTSAHGAESTSKTDFAPLAGWDVPIFVDNNKPGEKYGKKVTDKLQSLTPPARVKIIRLPGLPEGGDIYDWLEDHDALEPDALKKQLMKIVKETPFETKRDQSDKAVRKLGYTILSSVVPKQVGYLVPEIIPLGMLSSLVSQEGVGKSTLVSSIIAHITKGTPWPNSPHAANPKGHVILFSHEEDKEYILVPRLIANGADTGRVVLGDSVVTTAEGEEYFNTEDDIKSLAELVEEFPETRLIVFDPITSYTRCRENSNSDVRRALKPLVDLAAKKNITVLMLSHLNKKVDLGMINRTIGSRAWSAVPRMVWGIRAEQVEDEEGHMKDTNRRFLLCIKSNVGPKPQGICFSIGESGRVTWEEERVDLSIDGDCNDRTGTENAAGWLKDRLAQQKCVRSTTLFDEGKALGFSEKMLYSAKRKLKIHDRKHGFGKDSETFWELPNDG